jgi:hypothetical protein
VTDLERLSVALDQAVRRWPSLEGNTDEAFALAEFRLELPRSFKRNVMIESYADRRPLTGPTARTFQEPKSREQNGSGTSPKLICTKQSKTRSSADTLRKK